MSQVAKKLYRSSKLLALRSKPFPSGMIQPAPPVIGIWRSGYRKSGKPPMEPVSLNDLPVPHGSWEKWNQRENERYNKHLTVGVGFFLFTLFMLSRVVDLNSSPPPLPENHEDLCPPPRPSKCV